MGTPAAPQPAAASSRFNWKSLIGIFELAANTSLVALSSAGIAPAGSAQLASMIETGINPLIASIGTGQTPTATAITALGAVIGVLNALKGTVKDTSVLAKIDEYLAAAQDGITGYLTAEKGFDPTNYSPVALIS